MGWISRALPAPMFKLAQGAVRTLSGRPQLGRVAFGELRRTRPICSDFGFSRGLPVDRYYIERFLDSQRADVRGHVLEIGEDTYTYRFGESQVTHSDVLHVNDTNPKATLVGDLADTPQIGDNRFDCIILTQTLQLIFRLDGAMATLHRILKPGGVLLLTVPGITQIATGSQWGPTWYWSFTERSVRKLLEQQFSPESVRINLHGNVLAATAQLHGLAASELTEEELAVSDPDYQVLITARAVKAAVVP